MKSKFPKGSGFIFNGNVVVGSIEYCNVKYESTSFMADNVKTGCIKIFRYKDWKLLAFSRLPKPEFKFIKESDGQVMDKVLHPEEMFMVLNDEQVVKTVSNEGKNTRVIKERDFPEALRIIRKMDSINYSGFLSDR